MGSKISLFAEQTHLTLAAELSFTIVVKISWSSLDEKYNLLN